MDPEAIAVARAVFNKDLQRKYEEIDSERDKTFIGCKEFLDFLRTQNSGDENQSADYYPENKDPTIRFLVDVVCRYLKNKNFERRLSQLEDQVFSMKMGMLARQKSNIENLSVPEDQKKKQALKLVDDITLITVKLQLVINQFKANITQAASDYAMFREMIKEIGKEEGISAQRKLAKQNLVQQHCEVLLQCIQAMGDSCNLCCDQKNKLVGIVNPINIGGLEAVAEEQKLRSLPKDTSTELLEQIKLFKKIWNFGSELGDKAAEHIRAMWAYVNGIALKACHLVNIIGVVDKIFETALQVALDRKRAELSREGKSQLHKMVNNGVRTLRRALEVTEEYCVENFDLQCTSST